jgi:N-acetylglucosaminyl-diphospho-decaprenol L-rhamnosyltransferase
MALADTPGSPAPEPSAIAPPRSRPAPPRTRQAELAVVVVNFCQWRNTARLVAQLRRSAAFRTGSAEVVVVDNHSPFHPVVRKLRRLRGVTIRRFSRNHGFARAVNRGAKAAPRSETANAAERKRGARTAPRSETANAAERKRGARTAREHPQREPAGCPWVLLLNPDVTVPDGFLDEALATARRLSETDPQAGVVGFRLRNRDGSGQASAGPFPTLLGTVAGMVLPRSRRKCRHLAAEGKQEVDWVTGGCLLVRRDCFEQLGGLDETFFLYYEDVDFCRRASDAGWSVWYDPSLDVTHHWPLHARRVPAALRLMTRHALLTYSRKHWGGWQSGLLAGLIWAEAGLRQTWAAVRGDGDSARCYGQLRRLVGDVCRGRTADVRKRIRRAAAFLDPVAAEQDGRTA